LSKKRRKILALLQVCFCVKICAPVKCAKMCAGKRSRAIKNIWNDVAE